MQEISDAQVLFRKNPRKFYLEIFMRGAFENKEIEQRIEVVLPQQEALATSRFQ
ncbi:hypothetical protein RI570_01710 [Brucella pseudogrignonensis]|uniref:hypothetical protein n=1 Tax=Brucella pseudogrignonensis TaxID=419475 RepID=UPI0028B32C04|nr:hypothetical protein [Brucella pseudogrignonensis]MDT6938866.1 hypothetical protein [Brucella pseudogrignonensis]